MSVYKKRNSCKVSPLRKQVKQPKLQQPADPGDFDVESSQVAQKWCKRRDQRKDVSNVREEKHDKPKEFLAQKKASDYFIENQEEKVVVRESYEEMVLESFKKSSQKSDEKDHFGGDEQNSIIVNSDTEEGQRPGVLDCLERLQTTESVQKDAGQLSP